MSEAVCGLDSQRLKAERELDRDLREAEATESREKKTKLVGGSHMPGPPAKPSP